jgi:RNA polymerase sigma-70 factor (ECF subfamily)
MTDEVLLEKACRGDEAAFGRLYERFRGPLYALAYRLTNSVPIAEDLVHDTILSVVRPGSRFDPQRGNLRSYLYAAIRNLARKQYRDYGREEADDDLATAVAEGTPHDSLVSAETSQRVQDAVSSLPGLQREALVLFEYEELSLDEIARMVEADVGTVKSRLHRARERLRRVLLTPAPAKQVGMTEAGI